MTSDILARKDGKIGHLSLNKPKSLHALKHDMVKAMTKALLAWRDDTKVEAVILDHAEGRGFCAGGDIAELRKAALGGAHAEAMRFFFDEYRLNHLMFYYPKPIVAFMDGVVMGGGAGIAAPAKYRVATENTKFAMPETAIGMIPDVGGSYHLSRLPGQMGKYLALTCARIEGAQTRAFRIASHYLPASELPRVKTEIIKAGAVGIEPALASVTSPTAPPPKNYSAINAAFAPQTVEDINQALTANGSVWAQDQLKAIAGKCPFTLKASLVELERAAKMTNFADVLRMEYRLVSRVAFRPDLAEGVRALIVDKDNKPKWQPAHLSNVTPAMLEAVFAPLPPADEWSPL